VSATGLPPLPGTAAQARTRERRSAAAGWLQLPPTPGGVFRPADPWLVVALLFALVLLVVTAVLAGQADLILAYQDAPSHVVTPRRVFDNAEASFAQLGTHWTPLYHVLVLPFVWLDPIYENGVSGTIVSILASLAACWYLYRLCLMAGTSRQAAFAAAVMLAASPSFLYAGVIPMLYATIMAATTANVYYLARWAQLGGGFTLLAAGLSLSLATLAHFDTWILAPLELAVVLGIARSRWRGTKRIESTVLLWLVAGGYGLFLFLLMNVMIYGDPLAFLGGTIDDTTTVFNVSEPGLDGASAYPHAAYLNAGPALVAAGAVGLVLYLLRARSDARLLIPLLLLYPLAFYTVQALSSGSIIIPGDGLGDWRNLRYGVTILPALAFFAAAGIRNHVGVAVVTALVCAGGVLMATSGQVAAWEDAEGDVPYAPRIERAAQWMGEHATAGRIYFPAHHEFLDRLQLQSGLDSSRFIDANDSKLWKKFRRRPHALIESDVKWIVWLRVRAPERVRPALAATGANLCFIDEVPDSGRYLIRIYSTGECPAKARHTKAPRD